jgi:hypothetical protein
MWKSRPRLWARRTSPSQREVAPQVGSPRPQRRSSEHCTCCRRSRSWTRHGLRRERRPRRDPRLHRDDRVTALDRDATSDRGKRALLHGRAPGPSTPRGARPEQIRRDDDTSGRATRRGGTPAPGGCKRAVFETGARWTRQPSYGNPDTGPFIAPCARPLRGGGHVLSSRRRSSTLCKREPWAQANLPQPHCRTPFAFTYDRV